MPAALKVLINGKDCILIEQLQQYFRHNGHSLIHCQKNIKELTSFDTSRFDACVVDDFSLEKDTMFPVWEVRNENDNIPIFFISEKNTSSYKIAALKQGADAFVNKPFQPEELLLRIQAFVRRTRKMFDIPKQEQLHIPTLQIGKYIFDHTYQKLHFGEETIKLTSRESELLYFFYLRKEEIIERNFVLREIWGDDDKYKSRSMDVFITRLRKYLNQDENIKIVNTPNVGLQFFF